MKSSFKENFDKYELLLTPFFLIVVLLIVIIYMPQLVPIDNFNELFAVPLVLGCLSGAIIGHLLDTYWKKASFTNIGDFLKLPTLVLILLSSFATLLVTYDVILSFVIIGFGLGNMFTLISITSLVVFYRTFYKTKEI